MKTIKEAKNYASESEKTIKAVAAIVRRNLPKRGFKVFLFGSWVRGNAEPRSDIDIGVLGEMPIDESALIRIKEKIAELPTLRKIEIVDLNKVERTFKKEVLSYAKVL